MEGPLTVLDEAAAAALLHDLSAHFEAPLAPKTPWSPAKMTPARFAAMLKGIVAYEMRIQRFEGVAKLSQNKPAAEIARVAEALAASPDDAARRIAVLMGWRGE